MMLPGVGLPKPSVPKGPKRRESSKAENCCNKCCQAVCRMSPWNQLICWCGIALCLTGTILLIVGGFAVAPDANITPNLCGPETMSLNNGTNIQIEDPTVPLLRQNVYAWYLASTGIVVIVMIIFNCLCCASFVGLCCGLKLGKIVKAILFLGFLLFGVMLIVYLAWVGGGTYLIITFSAVALLNEVCRGIVVYVLMLYMYLVVLLVVMILTIVWCMVGKTKSSNLSKLQTLEKGKQRKK